eukprot:TCONS_00033049-protein
MRNITIPQSLFILLVLTIQCCTKHAPMGTYPTNYFKKTVPRFKNNRPMIGVLTVGLDMQEQLINHVPDVKGKAYVGSSYIKFLESAGARAVPIIEDIDEKELAALLPKLSGVLLPGNDDDTGDGGYYKRVKQILQYSKMLKKKNQIKFPVLGICRGAQRMLVYMSGSDSQLAADAVNMSLPLKWHSSRHRSRLFGHAPSGLVEAIEKKPIAFFHSNFVIPTESFYNNTKLKRKVRVLSTNVDRNGTKFISSYEVRRYPWYGLQWQPEKAPFEFSTKLAVDHSPASIMMSQYIANFFVGQSKENPHHFASLQDEEKHNMNKDRTYYVGNVTDSEYDQIYLYPMKRVYGFTYQTSNYTAPNELHEGDLK